MYEEPQNRFFVVSDLKFANDTKQSWSDDQNLVRTVSDNGTHLVRFINKNVMINCDKQSTKMKL